MKLTLTAIFFLLLASAGMQARQQDTVFVSDYGIRPYTYENQTERLRAVIDDCKRLNAKVLVFKKGVTTFGRRMPFARNILSPTLLRNRNVPRR